jgi:hypothetical protein
VHTVIHAYPEKTVELHFYKCSYRGEPRPMMGQAMEWIPRRQLDQLPFPDADKDLIRLLAQQEIT